MDLDGIWWALPPAAALAGLGLGWWWRGRRDRNARRQWPTRWNLHARPLFNAQERALHRELKDALPQHLVLAKVSLLRFCQAHLPEEARQWYDRLVGLHVALLVCPPNGSVISAIDFDLAPGQRDNRGQKFKEAVLEACRIRYLKCRPGQWPQQGLLATWALGHSPEAIHPHPAQGMPPGSATPHSLHDVGDQLAKKLRERRAERAARWAESGFAPDSFFAFDAASEGHSGPTPLSDEVPTPQAQQRRA